MASESGAGSGAQSRGQAGLSLLSYFFGMNSVASHKLLGRTQLSVVLLAGTMLATPLMAQEVAPPRVPAPTVPAPAPEAVPAATTVQSITVVGNQRLEAQTILSYLRLRVGQQYDRAVLDQALKDLAATELFKDFQITDNNGALTIQVAENPVINRVILEGNKRLKEDKIRPEIKMAPRQIYTRSKVRADVARIIELYKRQGRL